jgi:hypothetical protein
MNMKNKSNHLSFLPFNAILYLVLGLLLSGSLLAQPTLQWQTSLGSTEKDLLGSNKGQGGSLPAMSQSMALTADGGCVVAGTSFGNDGDVTGHNGPSITSDYWVVKLDRNGLIDWQLSLGGSNNDEAFAVQQTADGGYIVAGSSSSNDGDVNDHIGAAGTSDVWVVKLDANANIEWTKSYGGTDEEQPTSILQTPDGGYVFSAFTRSNDVDVSGNHIGANGQYDFDYWVVKLDASGTIVWQKCFGGSGADIPSTLRLTSDGNYILTGSSESQDGDVTNPQMIFGILSNWTIKISNTGNLLWEHLDGGSLLCPAYSIKETPQGHFLVAAAALGNGGSITGHSGMGNFDYWILELDNNGSFVSQQCIGDTSGESPMWIDNTIDGGYILNGFAFASPTNGNKGETDYWLVKLDSTGSNVEWQKSFGGTGYDDGTVVLQATDGRYFIAGSSESNDGDVSGHHGPLANSDIWVAMLAPEDFSVGENGLGAVNIELYPNPAHSKVTVAINSKKQAAVKITISDLTGKTIATLFEGKLRAGENEVETKLGANFQSGFYLINISGEDYRISKKLNVLR